MLSQASFVLVGLISSVSALALNGPVPTQNIQASGLLPYHSNHGPTMTPFAHDLLRRQEVVTLTITSTLPPRTLLAGPDDTCGYLGGASDRPWGCATGNCFFATPTPVTNGANFTESAIAGSVLCCDPSTGCPSSPAPTACVDYYNNTARTVTSKSGSADPMTMTCTSGLYIFCNTLTFATPSISDFFCNYIFNTAVQNATTTYAGQVNHAFTPTVPIFAVTFTPTTSTTPSSVRSSGQSSSSSAIATSASSTGGKKVNKGAIIGSVVGGVVGLALIIGAVIILFKRSNGAHVQEEGEGTQSPVSEEVVKPTSKA